MLDTKYHTGRMTLAHDNGVGFAAWSYQSSIATISETLEPCFFDLANRGRKRNPMLKVGHMIEIGASDGWAKVRIMSMGEDFEGITVCPVMPVFRFDGATPLLGLGDQEPEPKKKARRGRPPKTEEAAPSLVESVEG